MMRSIDNLFGKVVEWGKDKGIVGYQFLLPQFLKVQEEVEELEDELTNYTDKYTTQIESDIALCNAKLELGDCMITLILLAEDLGTTAQECLELAYEKIKNRTGKVINGKFVKEEDIEDEE